MNVLMNDPTNHKVYGYITEEYFYKVLQRAKIEKLFVDEHGMIDINKLIQLMWETFADGKYIILQNHTYREKVIEFIKHIDDEVIENNVEAIEAIAEKILEVKPKRKSPAKSKKTIDSIEA